MNIKEKLAQSLKNHEAFSSLDLSTLMQMIEIPPERIMGDFAFPCFILAKTLQKSPQIIAFDLAGALDIPLFEKIEAKGPYINFFLHKTSFIQSVCLNSLEKKTDFAKSAEGKGQIITLDYSSPNIAKSLHVGHLRSTVIGRSLHEMYAYFGYSPIAINHLGDWGTQFGKLIVAYKNWSTPKAVDEKGIEELNRIYIKFGEEAALNSQLDEEARQWFVKLEQHDPEAMEIWQWFKDISMKMFEDFYTLFDLKMDYNTGESFYNDKMDAVVDLLTEKNLLIEDNGAMMVDLEAYDMPPALIIRSDGGTLYMTRDLATAIYRKNEFNFSKSLYITDAGQSLHFKQLFKVLELLGFSWAADLVHVPFGLYLDTTGKRFSTRAGTGVAMDDVIHESISRSLQIIEDRNPELADKEKTALEVGVGAIIFYDLYNTRGKNIVFSWEDMLNFEGESGPYVQYTHARASSVLENAKNIWPLHPDSLESIDFSLLEDADAFEISKLIGNFSDTIREALERSEPYLVARQIMRISQAFNRFYHTYHILDADPSISKARLALTQVVVYALQTGMNLLGMKAPKKL